MCWCYWKIKNNNEKMLKIYNEGKKSAKEFINSNKNIIAMDTDSIIFTKSNERYKITINNNLYGIFDKIKQKFLTYKDICRKLNRLEYFKGICFD